MRKPKSIVVEGRRWTDKTYGNTYHTALCYVDGRIVATVPFSYGYCSQYEYNACAELAKGGYLKGITYRADDDSYPSEPLSIYCRRVGIAYTCTVADVARKRDLHNQGRG